MCGLGIQDSMRFSQGQLPVRWSLQDIEALDFFYEPFNDIDAIDHWTQLWGYTFRTGLQADFRTPQPSWTQQVIKDLADQGWSLQKVGTSFYVMRPGDVLPRHQDTYSRYCAFHGVDADQIWRAIVFLQPWHSGHLCEVDDRAVTGYEDGHYVIWHNDAPHLAGNVGAVPRYTLQITGIRDASN